MIMPENNPDKIQINTEEDLSLIFTADFSYRARDIIAAPKNQYDLRVKENTIAIVTDGSDIVGLGNLGAEAALPMMEEKARLYKEYADIDAFPICLQTQNTQEIVEVIRNILPIFAGINIEDIESPRAQEIEQALQDAGIPVYQDDYHGLAISLLSALINASILSGKNLQDLKVVINGVKPITTAFVQLVLSHAKQNNLFQPVKEVLLCDASGIISRSRHDLKEGSLLHNLAHVTNKNDMQGSVKDALLGADVYVEFEPTNTLTEAAIQSMADKPVVFSLESNELDHEKLMQAGAFICASQKEGVPSQIDSAFVFPGIFRGVLDADAKVITHSMQVAAAVTFAQTVDKLSVNHIVPTQLNRGASQKVAQAVAEAFHQEFTSE